MVHILQVSLHVYSDLILEGIFDSVPRLVRHIMVATVQKEVPQALILYFNSELLEYAMGPDPEIKQTMDRKQHSLKGLERALQDFKNLHL